MPDVIKVGVVAYDPKVVTIWEGIKDYFTANRIAMDLVEYQSCLCESAPPDGRQVWSACDARHRCRFHVKDHCRRGNRH